MQERFAFQKQEARKCIAASSDDLKMSAQGGLLALPLASGILASRKEKTNNDDVFKMPPATCGGVHLADKPQ